jgi:hypothetical protein
MSRDEVIASIGAPDFSQVTTTWGLPGGTRFPTADYAVYEPAAGDDQTRTTIYFVGEVVNRVQRDVVRRSP